MLCLFFSYYYHLFKFDLNRGPALGKLKAGETLTLDNGTQVRME